MYVDSSALVKLVVHEAETVALEAFLGDDAELVSCLIARTEVVRAVKEHGTAAVRRARAVLDAIDVIDVDETLVDAAAQFEPPVIRSLDALHLAAADAVRDELDAIVTYDLRMADAARSNGIRIVAPGT